jgi:hypothetical protein
VLRHCRGEATAIDPVTGAITMLTDIFGEEEGRLKV